MVQLLRRLNAALRLIEAATDSIAALAMMIVMIAVVIDVGLRYLANSPLPWSYDLISIYLIIVLFYGSLSSTLARGQHIAVDILFQRLSDRVRRVLRLITWVMTAVVFWLILELSIEHALSAWRSGDVLAGRFAWPMWIPPAIVAIGVGIILLRLALTSLALAIVLLLPETARQIDPQLVEMSEEHP